MAYRDDADTLKREVERLRSEVAALRSQRWQKLAEWARKHIRAAVVVAGCAVFAAWFRTCGNGPCKAVASREALAFVERTRGFPPRASTVYCAQASGPSYDCFATPRNGQTIRLRCDVNATWDVGGCRPHGE
jgi:hypothetical protein